MGWEFVWVGLNGFNIKYWEKLGYEIPRYFNKHNGWCVKRGTKILVKVSDLPKGSSVLITAICKKCGKERIIKFQNYSDNCHKCSLNTEEYINSISGKNNPMFGNKKAKSEKTKQKISQAMKGIKFSEEHKEKISKAMKGKKHPHSEETIEKMRKPKSKETIEKMRNSTINRIEIAKFNGEQFYPNFNRTACMLIEQYGQDNSFNFQTALNGKELRIIGYFPDGYDKEKNTIIEIDEPYHENPKQMVKDVIRQKNLIEHLKCDFIRIKIDDNYNILDTIIFKYF